MNKITKDDILNHIDYNESLEITRSKSKNIKGYVCHEMIHILYVLKQIMGDKCKTYLEVGTHNGGSMMTVMESKHLTKFYGVDIWWRDEDRIKAKQNINKNNKHKHEFTLIKGDSMLETTFEKVVESVSEIDFLFIDGGHDYETVKNDFNRYSKIVSKGGVIVFDDYLMFEKPNPFNNVEKKRKGQVRVAVDDMMKEVGDTYNIIGILPNKVGAITSPKFDYNISYILQKK